jgi:enterochelin esterase-like enzyme
MLLAIALMTGTVPAVAEDPTAGQVLKLTYPTPTTSKPKATNNLQVYLPKGYDPRRSEPYPVLYLAHGVPGAESDWMTAGDAPRIVEDAIAAGVTQPFVIVTNKYSGWVKPEIYSADLINNLIPFAESQFNIAKTASGRAVGGLSWGGALAIWLFYHHPDIFEYFGGWSASTEYVAPTSSQLPGMQAVQGGLHSVVGASDRDTVSGATLIQATHQRENGLTTMGMKVKAVTVEGGHSWAVWRLALTDFVRSYAFKATTLSLEIDVGQETTLVAKVAGLTNQPIQPSGQVSFYADKVLLGVADLDQGIASWTTTLGKTEVMAIYSGDTRYSSSTSHPSLPRPRILTGGAVAS